MGTNAFGQLMRHWRTSKRMSQLTLAQESEVSARHISCLETGKAKPSREMVLVLASAMDIPLRERNALLQAAGFAAAYRDAGLASPEMAHVREAIEFIMTAHEPHGVVVFDRSGSLMMMNRGAQRMLRYFVDLSRVPPEVAGNIFYALFHPAGLRSYLVNWEEVAGSLMERLHRDVALSPEPGPVARLVDRIMATPGVPERFGQPDLSSEPRVLLPIHLRKNGRDIRLFTTLTSLGTPLDVGAQELSIETYFPADAETRRWVEELIEPPS